MGLYSSRWEETNTLELFIVPRITDMCRNFAEYPKQTTQTECSSQNATTENVSVSEAGGDPIMLQPSATETTQLTSDGHHSYHTDTGFN